MNRRGIIGIMIGDWERDAQQARAYGLNDAGSARAVHFLDLDGDGDEDAVVTNAVQTRRPGGIVVYQREGDHYEKVFSLNRGKANAFRSMAAGVAQSSNHRRM